MLCQALGVLEIGTDLGTNTLPEGGQGMARGIFQTYRYVGVTSATAMIGRFYGTGVNQKNWGRIVLVMLGSALRRLPATVPGGSGSIAIPTRRQPTALSICATVPVDGIGCDK